MAYKLRFVLLGLVVPLLLLVTCATLLALAARRRSWGIALAAALTAGLLARAITTWKWYVRSGSFAGAHPTSKSALVQVLQLEPEAQVVGGTWSFYLNRTASRPPVVFTHRMRGFDPASGRWLAGTTIGDLQRSLRESGRTLPYMPSVASATLGGWIASGSHGSAGTETQGLSALVRCAVFDRAARSVVDVPARQLSEGVEHDSARFVVLDVEVHAVEDVWTRRVAFRVDSERSAERFFATPSYLRLLLVGGRGTLCLLWQPTDETRGRDRLDQRSLWLHADWSSIRQRRRAATWFPAPMPPEAAFDAVQKLSDANDFTPLPPLAVAALYWVDNFEWLVELPALSAPVLWRLCAFLEGALEDAPARCEVRYFGSTLCLDFAFANGSLRTFDLAALREGLHRVLGPGRALRLHRGKLTAIESVGAAAARKLAPAAHSEGGVRACARGSHGAGDELPVEVAADEGEHVVHAGPLVAAL